MFAEINDIKQHYADILIYCLHIRHSLKINILLSEHVKTVRGAITQTHEWNEPVILNHVHTSFKVI